MTSAVATEMEVKPFDIEGEAGDVREVAKGLSKVLADTYTLYLKTHNYHWNVTGPMFHTLHLLFEEQYRELWAAGDRVAERIRALGFPAPGSFKEFSTLTYLQEAEGVPPAAEMIRQLVRDNETAARTARWALSVARSALDAPTEDLLTQRLAAHDRAAWMLRSLLADKKMSADERIW
ncbi:MAG TPA: DNA starvation/stationary phase protection protein [Pyrinomonadaceae bacterium]|nr:DNA starvation/stationary phase protection protein [Pyrinomonadaceae bacterium]